MPEKIPDHILVKDLLRIKGENESLIQELEAKVKDLESDIKKLKKGKMDKDFRDQLKAKDRKISEQKQEIYDINAEKGVLKRMMDDQRKKIEELEAEQNQHKSVN